MQRRLTVPVALASALAVLAVLAPADVDAGPQALAAVSAQPSGAALEFEADGVDPGPGYINRVLVGGQELAILDEPVVGFATVSLPIPDALLSSGETEVVVQSVPEATVPVDAGFATTTPASPVDDFMLRDVRLILPGGTELRDRDHKPGRAYEITGEAGDQGILAPVKFNPARRYLFTLPTPGGRVAAPLALRPETAVAGSADAKPLREADESVHADLSERDLAALTDADDERAVTEVEEGFAYQELHLDVSGTPADSAHLQISWEGQTSQDRGASLFGFDHDLGRYVELASARDAVDDVVLRARVDRDSFVRDDVVRLMVSARQHDIEEETDLTVAWVTDSQFQTQANLRPVDMPGQIADWLVANREAEQIDYMAYTGDLVENFSADPSEFAYVSEALQPLDDAGFPYGVVPGNHDYFALGLGPGDQAADDVGTDPDLAVYAQYFGADRFEGRPHYAAEFRNNENHVDVLETERGPMAFLYMGWDAQPEEFAWAADQLTGPLADMPVVLAMHEYLDLGEAMQQKGTAILEQLVAPHDNVFAVISGHFHGVAYQVRRLDQGRFVLEILHDYQDETEGGAAYFRMLHFDLDGQQITSREYSPHHDDFLIEGFDPRRQEFTLPLALDPVERRVATDQVVVGTGEAEPRAPTAQTPARPRPQAAPPTPRATPTPTPQATPSIPPPVSTDVRRLAGADRLETAALVSQSSYEAADTVVLARADEYADALTGAPLAVAESGPLLLTGSEGLSAPAAAEVRRLGAVRAVLLGGTDALFAEVEQDLSALGVDVERVAGADRYETAGRIADRLGPSEEILLAEGANADPTRGWPDALSAAGLGAATATPVLLTGRDDLAEATAARLRPQQAVTIVGGPAAVSEAVAGDVQGRSGDVRRLFGATRYGTSAAVAERALVEGVDPAVTYVATGLDWPDGLTAGAAAGAADGLLLLVDGRDVEGAPETLALLEREAARIESLRIVGGTDAVAQAVARRLTALMNP